MLRDYEHLYRLYTSMGSEDVQTKIFYSGLLKLIREMLNEMISLRKKIELLENKS